jgi:soluble epoxide hydrolase / lipid-phosphate phosphatase
MEAFEKKTLKTTRGYVYTYYTIDGDNSYPALFFLHGWPDNAEMWKDVAAPLSVTRHPIIVPDLLGYDGTDKPTDPAEYRWDKMLQDLIEIADKENRAKLISIGHDFGSVCASHLYCYYPDRIVGLININVPYAPLARRPFDLEGFNEMARRVYGFPLFAYWYLFTAEDGPKVLQQNLSRLYDALHGQGDTLKELFCVPDGLRNYLLHEERNIPNRPYAQNSAARNAFIERFKRDGFEGPQCWYRARYLGYEYEVDKNLPEDRDTVNVPTLFVGGKDDFVCRPEALQPHIEAGLLPKLEQKPLLDAGHWTTLEVPGELVSHIKLWLKKNF